MRQAKWELISNCSPGHNFWYFAMKIHMNNLQCFVRYAVNFDNDLTKDTKVIGQKAHWVRKNLSGNYWYHAFKGQPFRNMTFLKAKILCISKAHPVVPLYKVRTFFVQNCIAEMIFSNIGAKWMLFKAHFSTFYCVAFNIGLYKTPICWKVQY